MKTHAKLTNRKIRLWPFVLAAVFLVLCWVSGFGTNTWEWKHLELYGMDFGDAPNKSFYLERGAEHGMLNSGPYFSLEAGTYKLKWSVLTDAPNRFQIVTGNGARVEPAEIVITPNEWACSQEFTLLDDAENLQILIGFENGTYMAVHDVTMTMECSDRFFAMLLLVLALLAWYVLECTGCLTPERKKTLLIIGLAVLFASIPALRENLNTGHDSEFHRSRLRNLAFEMEHGRFMQKVGGYMFNSYGSAAAIFYPEMWFVVPALMMVGGATIQFALSFLYIAINAVSGLNMYLCAKRIFSSRTAATCSAVLFVLASYRVTDLHVRCAMGETPGMAMFPLFILGLWEVIFGDKDRWPVLTLGAMCVFQSHMISTGLAAVVAVAAGVCFIGKIVREKRLLPIVKAAAMTVLMGLFYLVPFMDYGLQGINAQIYMCSPVDWALEPVQLFASDSDFPRVIGTALLLAVMVTLYMTAGRKGENERFARLCILVGAACCFAATNLFPWALARRLTLYAVDYMQFPWRLMILVNVFLCIAGGYGFALIVRENPKMKDIVLIGVLSLSMLSVHTQIMDASKDNDYYRFWKSNTDALLTYEGYQLPGTNLRDTLDYTVYLDEGVTMTDYVKDGTEVTADVSAEKEGSIALPLFAFDGYRVTLNGEEIGYTCGVKNRLTIHLDEGAQGELHVWFAGKALWKAAEIISLAAGCALAAIIVRKRKRAALAAK